MADPTSDRATAPAGPAERLLQFAGRLLATLIEGGQTRIDLLSLELAVERGRFVRLLLLVALCIASGVLASFFVSALIIIYFWDSYRLAAAGSVAGIYLLIAMIAGFVLWQRLRDRQRPFAQSIATLRRDLASLRGSLRAAEGTDDDRDASPDPLTPGD
ncbi:MAG TPA: phage holin family protein, partial [Dongiaceae bacterium]